MIFVEWLLRMEIESWDFADRFYHICYSESRCNSSMILLSMIPLIYTRVLIFLYYKMQKIDQNRDIAITQSM